jgi:hypothetical protein
VPKLERAPTNIATVSFIEQLRNAYFLNGLIREGLGICQRLSVVFASKRGIKYPNLGRNKIEFQLRYQPIYCDYLYDLG